MLVISNPVNSTVPIVAEVFKKHDCFDPKRSADLYRIHHCLTSALCYRLFGVTTLDVVRASTFVAEVLGDLSAAPAIRVPVVGGHSGVTIVPLLSQSSRPLPGSLTKETLETLTKRVQFGGDEVVKAKDGAGSATLSMAYAGAEFAEKVLRALEGEKDVEAPTYVHLSADPEGAKALSAELGEPLDFFSSRVQLGVRTYFYYMFTTSCS